MFLHAGVLHLTSNLLLGGFQKGRFLDGWGRLRDLRSEIEWCREKPFSRQIGVEYPQSTCQLIYSDFIRKVELRLKHWNQATIHWWLSYLFPSCCRIQRLDPLVLNGVLLACCREHPPGFLARIPREDINQHPAKVKEIFGVIPCN